jgi:pimeloyl-ACP methyl ester carboxylesterase
VLAALSPQRRRLVFAAAGIALLLIVVLAAVLAFRPSSAAPVPQDNPGPVLLVPGYGGTGESLAPLADRLRSTGREAIVVPPVGDGTADLRVQARHLGEVAARVLDDTGERSVDVVGYSAGGVVARLWVRDYGGEAVARRVVTLGSPHHGTSQAALGARLAGGCPVACEQLAPDSDVLRRLNAGDETPTGPIWVTVRSQADQVVTPPDTAALDGALNVSVQDVCPGSRASHGDLLGHPVVLTVLDSTLGREEPAAPAGVTC